MSKPDTDTLKLFARFQNPTTAHLVRSILESHDIPSFVMDHMNGGMNWDINGATRLMLMQSDFESAKQVLIDEDINLERDAL